MIIPDSYILPIHCPPVDNRWCRLLPPLIKLQKKLQCKNRNENFNSYQRTHKNAPRDCISNWTGKGVITAADQKQHTKPALKLNKMKPKTEGKQQQQQHNIKTIKYAQNCSSSRKRLKRPTYNRPTYYTRKTGAQRLKRLQHMN